MRFMIIVKATPQSEAGILPDRSVFDAMAKYHEELHRAGVLLDAAGLHPSARGWRIVWSGGRATTVDGPFAETKELVAGYTIIQVRSREEAMEWARRFPNPAMEDGEIEIRQLHDLEDFEPGAARDRFRALALPSQQ
ncbi:MAG TPA: YciI family protein [Longimicrobiales bacterium]|nr:YciI family protein [Longimicrobiales bacterium]